MYPVESLTHLRAKAWIGRIRIAGSLNVVERPASDYKRRHHFVSSLVMRKGVSASGSHGLAAADKQAGLIQHLSKNRSNLSQGHLGSRDLLNLQLIVLDCSSENTLYYLVLLRRLSSL